MKELTSYYNVYSSLDMDRIYNSYDLDDTYDSSYRIFYSNNRSDQTLKGSTWDWTKTIRDITMPRITRINGVCSQRRNIDIVNGGCILSKRDGEIGYRNIRLLFTFREKHDPNKLFEYITLSNGGFGVSTIYLYMLTTLQTLYGIKNPINSWVTDGTRYYEVYIPFDLTTNKSWIANTRCSNWKIRIKYGQHVPDTAQIIIDDLYTIEGREITTHILRNIGQEIENYSHFFMQLTPIKHHYMTKSNNETFKIHSYNPLYAICFSFDNRDTYEKMYDHIILNGTKIDGYRVRTHMNRYHFLPFVKKSVQDYEKKTIRDLSIPYDWTFKICGVKKDVSFNLWLIDYQGFIYSRGTVLAFPNY